MKARAGAFSVSSRAELRAGLGRLLQDENFRKAAGARAEAVVQENAGATERTLEKLLGQFPGIFSSGQGRGA